MTEIEKIVYAKSFIDKLAEGINPLVLYTAEAQRFILDHLDTIIQYRKNEKEKRKAEKQSSDLSGFHNRPWTPEHDERLSYLFHLNKTITEMAYDLRRTEESVRGRLSVMGLRRSDS